ncbi:MAG: type I restriction endonuclease subunit R [Ardenticatenaceae bacterium]|nr:type I restriction endonuclease subunit R [Ardenticatenaceae bacterium]
MTTDTSESGLESLITHYLVNQNQYFAGNSQDYDKALCMDRMQLFAFLEATQADTLAKIPHHDKLLQRISDQIRDKGIVEVLRKGIKYQQHRITLYYAQPPNNLNPEAIQNYRANRFSVTRQVHFSQLNSRQSLDMVIFINGLPLITFELKNNLTKQNVNHAKRQYREDRDPKEPLFRFARCLVHLAVDDQEVWMTTELKGEKTFFLPFNRGQGYGKPIWEAVNHGKGNPLNPDGLMTAYLWEEVLTKESLSGIVEKYARIIQDKDKKTGRKKPPKLVFPRFHQLDAVRKLLRDAQTNGVGQRYLIQHSAGSGKSYSIAWLAHQLVELTSLYTHEPIFNSIIVVTDRVVLNRQIRDTIKQYANVEGVVAAVRGSTELAEALEAGKKIIIATIQTFPFVLEKLGAMGSKTFAVIIDEAHSSQGGNVAAKMNLALGRDTVAEIEDDEDAINALVNSQKMLTNASYFAFTATPKNRTLQTFGVQHPLTGKYYPFHIYTMKQAIEERFIMDVLENYTTYNSYYKILKKVEDDPQFDSKRANKRLRQYVEGHPDSIRQKAEIMIQHFFDEVIKAKKIGGQAKAMVVTASIINAIEYFWAFQAYLQEINSPYKAIVAFSGTKNHKGGAYDEASLNGFPSRDIEDNFEEDEYRFLIVAEKYQTGFDQPLLHTMYVDKVLSDVKAVQTLSRLNRSHPDKSDTFVLDFVNSSDAIKNAFDDYYKTTILSEGADFDRLNDLQDALDAFQVYTEEQVQQFMALFIRGAERDKLDPFLDVSAIFYRDNLDEDEQIDFKTKAKSFVRLYQFLAQILPFVDATMESLKTFLKLLLTKLPAPDDPDYLKGILESVDLESYRVEHEATVHIMLEGSSEIGPVPTEIGGGRYVPELDLLSHIIADFNGRFGNTTWGSDEKVTRDIFEDLAEEVASSEEYKEAKAHSGRQNARIAFEKMLVTAVQKYIFTRTDFYRDFTNQPEVKSFLVNELFRYDYDGAGQ